MIGGGGYSYAKWSLLCQKKIGVNFPFIHSLQIDHSLLLSSSPSHPYMSHFLLPHPLLSTLLWRQPSVRMKNNREVD